MCPSLVLLQTYSGMSAAKASSACGPCKSTLHQLAEPTVNLYHTGCCCLSWASTWHSPALTLVRHLSKSAVRCYCHNMPLSSQHPPTTYSGCHHLHWGSCIWTIKDPWPKLRGALCKTVYIPALYLVLFPLVSYQKRAVWVTSSIEILLKQLWWDKINILTSYEQGCS